MEEELSFPVTVTEFLAGLPRHQVETQQAFAGVMKNEKPHRATTWQKLFELFRKKPTGVSWEEWRKQNKEKGGK